MKKMISYTLSLIVLTSLLFTGCGKEEENRNALKGNSIFEVNLSEKENVEKDWKYNVWKKEELERDIMYGKNILENVEEATVSDGTYSITLGMPLEDLEYDEEELPWDGVVVDNRVTTFNINSAPHDIIFHPYNDFKLYTSDFNHLNGDFVGYYNYIHEIQLKTDRFQTSDGFRVGMSEKKLKEAYGDGLGEKDRYGDNWYYYLVDMTDNVSIMFVINTEKIIEEIHISTDYGKYY